MCTRVNNTVIICIIGGFEFLLGVAVKSKLQHLHAGIPHVAHQAINALIENTEVLGNDLPIFFAFKKRFLRAIAPATDLCIDTACGDRIKAVKTAEMVYTHKIIQR